MDLSGRVKRNVFKRVLRVLKTRFYQPELLDGRWAAAVERARAGIEGARTGDDFERRITELLKHLNTSHIGFFHGMAKRASSRAALSATCISAETERGTRWVFQDVHEGGAAAMGGIQPGNVLLTLDDEDIEPPEHPVFPMGSTSRLEVVDNAGSQRIAVVEVSRPKGRKLHFIEPTLVTTANLEKGIGYLKVAMFPGVLGVEIANAISRGVNELGPVDRLVVDLRSNTGGGAGALRLMSLLTPQALPVGFACGKRWADRDLSSLKESFPRLNRIPESKSLLWAKGLRFLPALALRKPIVLETEGLGPQSFHGRVVLLVDRHTASAAEMVTIFAKENRLATLVGEPTAGRLLSATSAKVGNGYRLAFPDGVYVTWSGTVLEGQPIMPDVRVDFDWNERRSGQDRLMDRALEMAKAMEPH